MALQKVTREINKYADLIDSRDVEERIEELEAYEIDGKVADGQLDASEWEAELDELNSLRALRDEAKDYSEDWEYGSVLIRDSYFPTYAEELADDICPSMEARDMSGQWPYNCIDWERAANELRMDYSSVQFDGITFWIR